MALAALVSGGCPDYAPYGSCDDATGCDDKNPCTNDSCGPGNICVHSPGPDGNASQQVVGDCSTAVCRAGAIFNVPDDTDVVDDSNECTTDSCSGGKPINTPVLGGTACTKDKTPGTCVKAACVTSCKNKSDACDDGNTCTDEHCDTDKDLCVFTYRDDVPTPNVSDPKGNCRARRCVAGADMEVVDSTDLPKATSDCVTVACNEGSPSSTPLAVGAACKTSGGTLCDGQGNCLQCNSPDDCTSLPKDDACQTRTCNKGKCGQTFANNFTMIPGKQKTGDCQKVVCDGQGGQETLNDPNDIPDDFNDCTTDSCEGNMPAHDPQPDGTFCGFALKCMGGKCEGCKTKMDCIGFDNDCKSHTCNNGECTYQFSKQGTMASLQVNGDCQSNVCDGTGNQMTQVDDKDAPMTQDCTTDTCSNGAKLVDNSPRGTACSNGFCDGNATCFQCNDPKDCGDPPSCVTETCVKNTCGTENVASGNVAPATDQMAKDCQTVVCDGQGGEQTVPSNDIPDDGKECTIDTCNGPNPVFTPYSAGTPCPKTMGKTCDGKGNCSAPMTP